MQSHKFGRNYILNIQTESSDLGLINQLDPLKGHTLTVKPPFTIEFDITRNTMTSANVASIRVYNLKESNRNLVRKNISDMGKNRIVQLLAGYGTNMGTIFDGTITTALSFREGNNFITQIESLDGGFAFINSKSDITLPPGTPQSVAIAALMADLEKYGVKFGAVGLFPNVSKRSTSYSGNTIERLKELCAGFYIDNGKAYALGDTECVPDLPFIISDASGLLNTPRIEQTIINADMLFEPKITVGRQAVIASLTDPTINGLYKIVSVKHRGTISPSVAGDAVTSVGLMKPLGNAQLSFGFGFDGVSSIAEGQA